MTREEAIEVLTNLQNGHGVSYSESYGLCFGHTWMQAYEMAISALREQDSNANQHVSNTSNALGGWISVEERMPKKKGQYLTYTKWTYGNLIRLCNWTPKYNGCEEHLNGRAIWYNYDSEYGDYECKGVTHWMPLPEPPKEEV